ncbi:MAG: putative ABC transport system permease protein [Phycisphaerales bacterium]|jgi:putative ABC transport system permease protein
MKMLLTPLLFIIRICVQTVFLALGQIWANKTRSVLTCLGIIFGVAAVISVVGLLGGMKGFVLKEFETIGARKMWVWGEVPDDKRTTMSYSDVRVTLYEAELILDRAPSIESLTPMANMRMDLSYDGEVKRGVSVRGIWPEWHEIEDRQVLFGRPFSNIDDDENRQVCLVNQGAIDEMGLNTDPSGQFIQLNGRRFLCIGLVETKELAFADGGQSDQSEIYIPFNTLKMMNPYTGTYFIMQMVSPDVALEAEAAVRFVLRKHRQLKPEDEDTFGVQVMQGMIDNFNGIARVATLGGGFVAAISLFVGGIGIMNIMLVSVSERTREIGLRKAVGAKPPIVLLQFLVEAITLCVVGGLIGLAIGQGVVFGFKKAVDWMSEASVPPEVIAGALIVTAATGIIFGMFPAIKAARLNPIDALRHE